MKTIKEQLEWMKANKPKFKDLDLGPFENDLSGDPVSEEAFKKLKKRALVNKSNYNPK